MMAIAEPGRLQKNLPIQLYYNIKKVKRPVYSGVYACRHINILTLVVY
jgi:hypothetical protein